MKVPAKCCKMESCTSFKIPDFCAELLSTTTKPGTASYCHWLTLTVTRTRVYSLPTLRAGEVSPCCLLYLVSITGPYLSRACVWTCTPAIVLQGCSFSVFDSSKVTIKSVLEPAVLFSTPAEECRKHIWQRPANLFSAPVENARELSLSYSVKNSLIIWELRR